MIDMDNRLLWITGYGADRKLITPDYGNLITDNVYRYARSGGRSCPASTPIDQTDTA